MFEDDAQIRQHLISRNILTEQQISEAIDYALDRNVPFEDSLVALGLLTIEQLGSCLAEMYRMPYFPLRQKPPSTFCKKIIPLDLAEKWRVFPIEFNAENDLLTIAISEPDQIKSFLRLEQKVFAHHRLAFSIAPRLEIELAINTFYKRETSGAESVPEVPRDFSIITLDETSVDIVSLANDDTHDNKKILLLEPDIEKGRAIKTLLRREGYRNVTWVSSEREAAAILGKGHINMLVLPEELRSREKGLLSFGDRKIVMPRISAYRSIAPLVFGQELPYQPVSGALIALISAMVRERLKNDPDRLAQTAERARYCQLLALRLQCSPLQVDRAVLGGWLYEKELFGQWLQILAPAYRMESVIDEVTGVSEERQVESQVLSAVVNLFALKERHFDIESDIQLVRTHLGQREMTPASLKIIETLLAILKDEAFISGIDRPAARVLIVDPEQLPDGALTLRLQNDGLIIDLAATAQEALCILNGTKVDCIISETVLADADGIHLCKTIKNTPAHTALPFLFIASSGDSRNMAECLRAGADDFLAKPVDPEVLSLKLHRLLSKKLGRDSRAGVKGTLSQMGFSDLVQILSSGGKSVKITLDDGVTSGELYLDKGELVHATCWNATGEAAFYRLMRMTAGDFEVCPCSSFPERTIAIPVMGLLLEGARLDDESVRDASAAPDTPPPD